MALIGVGHLVGLAVGIAMFVGLLISWVFLVPHYTALAPHAGRQPTSTTFVNDVFRNKVRFIGAGTIGVAAIWTLLKIIGPIITGYPRALAASRERKAGRGEDAAADRARPSDRHRRRSRSSCSMIPIGLLLYAFAEHATDRRRTRPRRSSLSIIYILIAGVVIAAVTGYMAGLIGASNSPVSGVGILSVLGIALILAALFPRRRPATRRSRWSPSPCS